MAARGGGPKWKGAGLKGQCLPEGAGLKGLTHPEEAGLKGLCRQEGAGLKGMNCFDSRKGRGQMNGRGLIEVGAAKPPFPLPQQLSRVNLY